jgi:hypothetical protein
MLSKISIDPKCKKTSSTQQAAENQSFQQQQKRKLPITAGIIS